MTGNAPSAARLRHAEAIDPPRIDAVTFRQGWRVRTRLDALLAAGRIEAGTWQAAAEYRAAWETLLRSSAGTAPGLRVKGQGGASGGEAATLDRAARIRSVEIAIGAEAASLCRACAVEDLSWRTLGVRLGVRDVTAQARTVIALRALAMAWRRGGAPSGTGSRTGGPACAVLPPARRPQMGGPDSDDRRRRRA